MSLYIQSTTDIARVRQFIQDKCNAFTKPIDIILQMSFFDESFLTSAAKCGRLDILQYFVEQGVTLQDILAYHPRGNALQFANINNHITVVKYIISLGVQKKDILNSIYGVFRISCKMGHFDLIKYYVEYFKLSASDIMTVPDVIQEVMVNGHLHILQYFIEIGITHDDIMKVDCHGCSNLYNTMHYQNPELFKLLVHKLNLTRDDIMLPNLYNNTILSVVAIYQGLELIEFIVGLGLHKHDILQGSTINNLLMYKRLDIFKYFVEKFNITKSDMMIKHSDALYTAVIRAFDDTDAAFDVVKYLCEYIGFTSMDLFNCDKYCEIILHHIFSTKNIEHIIEYLLSDNDDITHDNILVLNKKKQSIIHCAIKEKSYDLIRFITKKFNITYIDLMSPDIYGMTPVEYAKNNGVGLSKLFELLEL